MKYQEGNYISTEYGELPIKHVVFDQYQVTGVDGRILWANDPKPIELTEEWLIKLGFKKRADGDFDLLEYSEVDIVISGLLDGWKCDGIWFSVNHLQYIHQLQNLYFTLTGEKLTLKSNL